MPTIERPPTAAAAERPLLEQVRTATTLLEVMGADWRLLDALPTADRRRLHRAIAGLSLPDRRARRKRTRAARAENIRRHEDVLDETGIRTRRLRPTVTTPNVFPPAHFEPGDIHAEPPANDEPRTSNDERRTLNAERINCALYAVS